MKKLIFFSSLIYLALPSSALAAAIVPSPDQIFQIPNFFSFNNLGEILQVLLTLAFFVAGVALLFNIVIGGLQWINAGGDPKAMTAARTRITNAVIGLLIVVAAYAVALIIGQVFGLSIVTGFRFI